ncbi:MAG: hypothetical protein HY913_11830 [Desulfomonile tiedjei]|nr:hypothetical protein [Desulfomonile tiedjei]
MNPNGPKESWSRFTGLAVMVGVLFFLAAGPGLGGGPVHFGGPIVGHWQSAKKKSMVEGRFGYLFGFNEIRLRDGDNANIPPSKREVPLDGLVFGLEGETFVMEDLAVRIQGWINVPFQIRSDFYLNGSTRSWDSLGQYVGADLSAIYHFGLGGMPYTAGLVAGYRYNNFDYQSKTVGQPAGTSEDHFHVHIPYLGVYYANSAMMGSVVRLDILFSPLALTRLDAQRRVQGAVTNIEGHSVTGIWFESYFQWSRRLSPNALLGVFANYDFLQLSGGATEVQAQQGSTRFSLDSRHHLFMTGISATYTF